MATEQVEQVTEVVADHLEEVAEVTRKLNPTSVQWFLGGTCFGIALGFFIGYRFSREKIKAEVFKKSEEEIEEIREHYQSKILALENTSEKAEMHSVIVEEQYVETPNPSSPSPIADLSKLRTQQEIEEEKRPLPPPVVIRRTVFRHVDNTKDKMDGWNFASEMAKRTPERPYIIHQDEFANNESEFAQVTYTYYAADDVLVDEDEQVLTDRDELIGQGVLTRFGHGTDDYNILYVCNPVLELEIEICRSQGSYEEEVLGLERGPNDATEN